MHIVNYFCMLDIAFIRTHADMMREVVRLKNVSLSIDELLEVDDQRREKLSHVESLRAQRNEVSAKMKDIATLNNDEKQECIRRGKELKIELSKEEALLKDLEQRYHDMMYAVPNTYADDTPLGKDDTENVTIKTVGTPPTFDFEPKEHWELGVQNGTIDTESSAIISGSRFAYVMGDLVRMQFGLVQFVFETLADTELLGRIATEAGIETRITPFTPVLPPMMMRPEIMEKMGRLHPMDDRYQTTHDGLMLIGSAEHTLGPLHMDTTFQEKDLPIRYIGYSTSFRREAGTYGKDMKGILRLHQFDKLEMETFTTEELGAVEQDFIIAIQEYLVSALGLPYQLSLKCTGDMGTPNRRAVDIETWLPGQNKYRETHTSDYMADFQSRRLNTQYVDVHGVKKHVHMNDATAFAIGRILIAIMENYQQEDGTITVPEKLVPYLGKTYI